MTSSNLAARAGAWSARHRRRAIFGWIAFVLIAATAGGSLGIRINHHEGSGESGRVDTFLRQHFPQTSTETILIEGRHGQLAGSPGFRTAEVDLAARVRRVHGVSGVQVPDAPGVRGAISKDDRSALLSLELGKGASIDSLLAATAAAGRTHPMLRIDEFGDASGNQALNKSLGQDFSRAEKLSLPITLLILVLGFGSLVAAGLPLLLGITAVVGTLGLIAGVSQLLPMDASINSVVLLIGLAVGVDYSLFYLRREREERAAGAGEEAALLAAAATSGRAILVSGLTVMIAMAGMFFAGSATFSSFAVGTIIVVAVAVVGSLTVLPALMATLGHRVERGRIPLLHRVRAGSGANSRVWSVLLGAVMRRPGVSAALSGLALIALALPVLGMRTAVPGSGSLPSDIPIVRIYDRIQHAFPGGSAPAVVGLQAADVRVAAVQRGIGELIAQAEHASGLLKPITTQLSADHRAETISIPIAGGGTDEVSDAALTRLRQIVPATVGEVHGVSAGVTGQTAGSKDFNDTMDSHLPLVFGFVLGMAFLLLLFTFRSIVIPLQAIGLNLLSVGAAYGLLVLVFQDGYGQKLLGFQGKGAITSWLPLFLFVVLFGLSMDYHVFILSRVREARERGMNSRDAALDGVRRTAGAVTSAAIVMVGVFAIFGTLRMIEFKQMGIGLAAAILIDATVIRGVLLPATLALLGDRAWYLPQWLQWLPGGRRRTVPVDAELAYV